MTILLCLALIYVYTRRENNTLQQFHTIVNFEREMAGVKGGRDEEEDMKNSTIETENGMTAATTR